MSATILKAYNPTTGEVLDGDFVSNTKEEVEEAVQHALNAFQVLRKTSGEERAILLETIAEEIEVLGDRLVDRATAETGLPAARIHGERGRTCGQLRLFASIAREGSWVEASIDTPIPGREPIPKPDLRKMLIPMGPVAVFAASNFPLAFSTAGGDTASALAGGNPVLVKGHHAHLGTHELISSAIDQAVAKCNLPKGVYTSVIGSGREVGQELVRNPGVRAVGFTGSRAGGRALYDIATSREDPIQVFAEMSSINPTIMLPEKTAQDADTIAKNLAGSITLGVGQFCTNPGLILGIEGQALTTFSAKLAEEIKKSVGGIMLTGDINQSYIDGATSATSQSGVQVLGEGKVADGKFPGRPMVAMTSGDNFLATSLLAEEVFGPYSLIVACKDEDQLAEVLLAQEGQLTATFMCSDPEMEEYAHLIDIVEQKAGRVIFNGVPTGVEVCHSMVHGGPYPATSDSKFTSVGADALKRFVRPVCYQNAPQSTLPLELQDDNPLDIWRKVDGSFTKDKI